MRSRCSAVLSGLLICALVPAFAREPLAARIAHADPAKYRHSPAVHDGPGALDYMALFDFHTLDTNLQFLHRGVILPKSGIGAHFHNTCEEMFVILDGEAQFTIDGRTSTLKAPAGALCRMGHSHAIYNATDKPVQWMNINVSTIKGAYDAFNLKDGREGAPLDPIPAFMTMLLDRGQFRPANGMHGAKASGAIPPRARSVGLPDQLVVCGSSVASAGRFHQPAYARGSGGILLCHERRGYGESGRRPRRCGGNRPHQGERCDPD